MNGKTIPILVLALVFLAMPAWPGPVTGLYEYKWFASSKGSLGVDTSAWDYCSGKDGEQCTGLGSIVVTSSGWITGFGIYVDMEIDEPTNTFFNEFGTAVGSIPLGLNLAWEIDEPGFVYGDIYSHLFDSLDNTNGVPEAAPDDVAMAMVWQFTESDAVQKLTLFISDKTPPQNVPFYLMQTDPDSQASIYMYGVTGGEGPVIPEPGQLPALLALGGALAYLARRLRA